MKRIIQMLAFCMLIVMSFSSCKKTTKGLRPAVTGRSGELVLLVNKTLWEGTIGDTLKSILNEPQIGLPQNEPLFDILQLPHQSFSSMFKTHRSILDIRISSKYKESKMTVKDALYARTQSFMKIEAPNKKEMLRMLDENRNKILAYFILGERNRKIKTIKKNVVQDIFDALKQKYGFTLSFPSGYKINKSEKDFMWISNETPTSSQGMFIYSYDYKSETDFSKEAIFARRNFLLKKYVPGPTDGSYMSTDMRSLYDPKHFEFFDNYALETRGLWNVVNDFMGGPFINMTFLDQKTNRVICIDAYVYYPNQKKRELLRELESIMYTYQKVEK